MRRRLSVIIAVGALMGACGDTTTTTAATTTTLEISDPFGPPFGVEGAAREFEFIPDSWTVPSNALLVLDFENQGTVEHFFVVIKDRVVLDSSADFDDSLVFRELRAGPGETASDTFLAPAELGAYQVICRVPGHLEAGMTARLIVER
jgi:plastocyanin